jgi:hypothetical protein
MKYSLRSLMLVAVRAGRIRGMTPARKEANRRFAIWGISFLISAVTWTIAGFFIKPIVDANPQSFFGPAMLLLGVVYFFGLFGLYRFIWWGMKSACPKCREQSAKMVKKPIGETHLECDRCGYSENTGWSSTV